MGNRYLQTLPYGHDKIWMIKNLIEHLERELGEKTIGAKRLAVLRNEISALKEKLSEME